MNNLWIYLTTCITPTNLPANYTLSDYQNYMRATTGRLSTEKGYRDELRTRYQLGDTTPTLWYRFTYKEMVMYYLAQYGETLPEYPMENIEEHEYTTIYL